MWLILLVLICSTVATFVPPEYCLIVALIPALVGVAFYLMTLKWYEIIAVLILSPIILMCML